MKMEDYLHNLHMIEKISNFDEQQFKTEKFIGMNIDFVTLTNVMHD